MPEKREILRVERLRKVLGASEVLKGIDLAIRKGEVKVLIGPSGSGKSTFLQCVNHLLTPDGGTVFLEGKPVRAADKRSLSLLRREVGMIFQDFNLFDHLTAKRNVRMALIKVKGMARAEADARAMAELERVGLADKADLYPAQLSGGQKQRVSIARALAMDPKALLLDEPTSALDPELIGEVLTVIRDLAKGGMTMLMATHQISFSAQLADEFLFMDQGLIVEQGAPATLLAKDSDSRTLAFCGKLSELAGGEDR